MKNRAVDDRIVRKLRFIECEGNNELRPTYYDAASLKRDLKRIGFADVQLFGPKQMNVRYCNDRADGLQVRPNSYLVKARV